MTRHLAGLLACLLAAGAVPAAAMTPDEAYDRLVNTFPNAGQQNFDAFYDHLCVLDLL
jgi:hypothetical protein